MKVKSFLPILLMGTVLFVSCKKDEVTPEQTTSAQEYKNLSVAGADWVYFSFEKDAIVEVTDPDTSNEWDIAFNQYDVKTRGALNTLKKDFEQVTEAPESGYTEDIERYTFLGRTVGQLKSSPIVSMGYSESFWQFITDRSIVNLIPENAREAVKASLVHNNGWQTFSYGSTGPTFSINNWIYIVKTANGKYAKIHIYSYTDEKNAPFNISFKYQICNDSRKF